MKTDKIKKIILLIGIILLSLLIVGCKTHVHYQHETIDTIILNDTIEIPSIHHHYTNENGENFCAWVKSSKIEFIDTINISIIEPIYCKRKIHGKNERRKT